MIQKYSHLMVRHQAPNSGSLVCFTKVEKLLYGLYRQKYVKAGNPSLFRRGDISAGESIHFTIEETSGV